MVQVPRVIYIVSFYTEKLATDAQRAVLCRPIDIPVGGTVTDDAEADPSDEEWQPSSDYDDVSDQGKK